MPPEQRHAQRPAEARLRLGLQHQRQGRGAFGGQQRPAPALGGERILELQWRQRRLAQPLGPAKRVVLLLAKHQPKRRAQRRGQQPPAAGENGDLPVHRPTARRFVNPAQRRTGQQVHNAQQGRCQQQQRPGKGVLRLGLRRQEIGEKQSGQQNAAQVGQALFGAAAHHMSHP